MSGEALEKYVRSNRAAFDDELPDLRVWQGIQPRIDRKRGRHQLLWHSMRIAAAVTLLLGIGALLGSYFSQPQLDAEATLAKLAPEVLEMQNYYQQEVNKKYQKLVSLRPDASVEEDLTQLDEVMEELKNELLVAPKGTEQVIIENLIRSYQNKINLLERVLHHMEQTDPAASQIEKDERVSL